MVSQQTFVIVGASLAGAKAAETLRDEGFGGRVVLVGEEPERPYERPSLSKDLLVGDVATDKVYVHEPGWYDDHSVELWLGRRAIDLDPAAHQLRLNGGERLRYDQLLLATGATPRALRVPGAELAGTHRLRTLGDAQELRAGLSGGGRRVVVVGGGWIGLEVAAAARSHGNDVTVVEPQPTPLRSALGDAMGTMFADLHRDHGVHLRLNTGVVEVTGAGDRVSGVVTSDGARLPADLVVVGVGARPNVELAEAAGLTVENGVVVDQSLRTFDPDIFAAGDVANIYSTRRGQHVRVEHWDNALHTGPAAARSMLGRPVDYDRTPYFFTDQYDLGMEYTGFADTERCDLVVRGDLDGREGVAFWVSGGVVCAGMNVNVWDVSADIEALVRTPQPVDLDLLADPDVPLAELLPR
ncbi:MAG: NAD(P)/FAD-dependent oxidoreductase [Nocardioidaceae bacterium]